MDCFMDKYNNNNNNNNATYHIPSIYLEKLKNPLAIIIY